MSSDDLDWCKKYLSAPDVVIAGTNFILFAHDQIEFVETFFRFKCPRVVKITYNTTQKLQYPKSLMVHFEKPDLISLTNLPWPNPTNGNLV